MFVLGNSQVSQDPSSEDKAANAKRARAARMQTMNENYCDKAWVFEK